MDGQLAPDNGFGFEDFGCVACEKKGIYLSEVIIGLAGGKTWGQVASWLGLRWVWKR